MSRCHACGANHAIYSDVIREYNEETQEFDAYQHKTCICGQNLGIAPYFMVDRAWGLQSKQKPKSGAKENPGKALFFARPEVQTVLKLLDEGMSHGNIAKEMGTDRSKAQTIIRRIQEFCPDKKRKKPKNFDDTTNE